LNEKNKFIVYAVCSGTYLIELDGKIICVRRARTHNTQNNAAQVTSHKGKDQGV
jgi:hypothetical protein